MTAEQEAEAQVKSELEAIQREEAEAHAAHMAREARKAALQRK
jgi:hypothetical protein